MLPWESCVLWLGYPLQNGVWPDISKYDNDGIITGAVWEGDSLEFDGVDDYVRCGNNPVLELGNNFSIELLIYSTNNNARSIIAKRGLGGDWPFLVLQAGKLRLYAAAGSTLSVRTIADVPVNEWVHYIITRSDTTICFYMNSEADAANPLTLIVGTPAPSADLIVGAQETAGGVVSFFEGQIALVRLYNITLTAEQVRQTYEQCYRLV